MLLFITIKTTKLQRYLKINAFVQGADDFYKTVYSINQIQHIDRIEDIKLI